MCENLPIQSGSRWIARIGRSKLTQTNLTEQDVELLMTFKLTKFVSPYDKFEVSPRPKLISCLNQRLVFVIIFSVKTDGRVVHIESGIVC